jgi:hypothetical protein
MQIWTDSEKYVGEWSGGLRHGQGKATFANKDTYMGDNKITIYIYIYIYICMYVNIASI